MHHQERLRRALNSLLGLAIGDAFGERYFKDEATTRLIIDAKGKPQPWRYTDDTQMALSVVENLARFGEIRPYELAHSFADHYESWRGYGPAMHGLLQNIRAETDWRTVAKNQFNGSGSFGNGGAMRVAPLGAYFWDNPLEAAAQARLSSEVTHAHPEGIAGAIAVAVAAGQLAEWHQMDSSTAIATGDFLDSIVPHVPGGEVRRGIEHAMRLGDAVSPREAAEKLGNGSRISAQDTVPFCLWCVARYRADYEAALWATVSGGGDRDTNCAIVGGILGAALPNETIPVAWRNAIEGWPYWFTTALEESGP